MLGKKRLIAAGLAVLIISVVAKFPAAVAYSWFAPESLKLNGINGSVWNGHATEGSLNGIYIGNIQWSMRPLALFTGRVAFSTHSEPASGSLNSNVAVSMLGTVYLSDLEGNLSLSAFERSFQLQDFDGQLQLQFDELVIADGIPTYAEGSIVVSQLLAPKLSPTAIGDFRADISTDESGIRGIVEDQSGVLDVAGTLLLGRDRSYSLVGKVAAAPNAPPGLQQQLRFLGSPDAAGKREFRVEGSL